MQVEDCCLLEIFQLPTPCSNECLDEFIEFVRECVKQRFRLTVTLKRPADISERVRLAMEKRKKKMMEQRSPEEIIKEKKASISKLIEEGREARINQKDYKAAVQHFTLAQNLNAQFPEERKNKLIINVELAFTYEDAKDQPNFIRYQERCIDYLNEIDKENELYEFFQEDLLHLKQSKFNRLDREGDQNHAEQQLDKAFELYEQSILFILPDRNEDKIKIKRKQAILRQEQQRYDDEIQLYEDCINILGENTTQYDQLIDLYFQIGKAHELNNNKKETISVLLVALDIFQKIKNKNDDQLILKEKIQHKLGALYMKHQDTEMALRYFQQALQTGKQVYGEEHLTVAKTHSSIGEAQKQRELYKEALESFTVAMNIRKKLLPWDQPSQLIAKNQMNIGILLKNLGNPEPAKNILQQSLAQLIKLDKNNPGKDKNLLLQATIMLLIGESYQGMGEPEGSEKIMTGALEIRERILGNSHHLTQQAIMKLISIYFILGKPQQALNNLIKIYEAQFKDSNSKGSVKLAQTCANIASVYAQLKDFDNAIKYQEMAYKYYKKYLPNKEDPIIKKTADKYRQLKQDCRQFDIEEEQRQEQLKQENKAKFLEGE